MGSCEESGILGAVTGVIGNLQALETIKLITGLHGTDGYGLLFRLMTSFVFLQSTNLPFLSSLHSEHHLFVASSSDLANQRAQHAELPKKS